MGLFGMFKKQSGTGETASTRTVNAFSQVQVTSTDTAHTILEKMPETEQVISLKKSVISLDKSIISLSKSTGVSLTGHAAKVAVMMDYSGSMGTLYRNGSVQRLLTRLMPLALKFDDNGELDVWLFDDSYRRLDGMTLANFDTYISDIMKNKWHMGCTEYAPVINDALKKYFVEEPSNLPAFVIFITDGANSDAKATDVVIRESSNKNIFIQFIGIGNSEFKYLEKLDDLDGRAVDNTGFFSVADMENLSDEQLFNMLLEQYTAWLKATGR